MSTSRDIFPEGELQRVEIKNVSEVLNTILQKHKEKVFLQNRLRGSRKRNSSFIGDVRVASPHSCAYDGMAFFPSKILNRYFDEKWFYCIF